jgi:hypothetical protein
VSERVSHSDWFPKPPPKPLKAASAATLLFACVIFAVAVAGVVFWLTDDHSGQKTKPAAPSVAVTTGTAVQDTRQTFAECMRNMGAGSSTRGGGRFSRGGPSKNFRSAFDVCRSLVQQGQPEPLAPPRTGTTPAPVA